MTNTLLTINFQIQNPNGLKGRRKIVNSLKDKLKNRFNISILDISSEYPKEATLALSFLNFSEREAKENVDKIDEFLNSNFPEFEFYLDVEID